MIETEIRCIIQQILPIQEKLKLLNFKEWPKFEQLDMIFDKPDARLFRSGQKIRIRIEKNYVELTYKGKFQKINTISRRAELTIVIRKDDVQKYKEFLELLGFPLFFLIKKERKIFSNNLVKITFDKWPILGYMVEIEGKESEIRSIASKIAPNYQFKNYRLKDLFLQKMEDTGKSITQLKNDYYKKTGFDLGNIEIIMK